MEEPPEIEGYLERIRPNTQTKQQTYLTTHHGYLFTLNSHTFPPMPPGLAPTSSIYSDAQALRHSEVRRGTNQVMNATGVMDLRSIMAVRRAFKHLQFMYMTRRRLTTMKTLLAYGQIWTSRPRKMKRILVEILASRSLSIGQGQRSGDPLSCYSTQVVSFVLR